ELVVPAELWHRTDGAEGMRRLLASGVPFDGAFCFNDNPALGAMHVLLRHGVRIPDDVAIIGFDDIEEAQFSMPPLSSIEPGRAEIARQAVELLVEQIGASGEQARPHRQVVADFTLRVRESTAGP